MEDKNPPDVESETDQMYSQGQSLYLSFLQHALPKDPMITKNETEPELFSHYASLNKLIFNSFKHKRIKKM